jgi:hypothetical protein
MSACPSELVLDRLVVGELAESSHDGVRDHVSACARCTGRVDERKAIAATFASDVGLDLRVAAVQRAVGGPRRRATWLAAAGAVAAAAVLLLVIVRRPDGGGATEQGATPGIRTKGGLSLGIIVKHGDGAIESMSSPAHVVPGEAIELEVSTHDAGTLVIAGVDAAGVITPYVPARHIDAGSRQLLDGSIVLDDTLGSERIVAVLCSLPATSETTDAAVARARTSLMAAGGEPSRMQPLALRGCSETSFVLDKSATGVR